VSQSFEQYAPTVKRAFGDGSEPIESVAQRAEALFAGVPIIVWEGDAQTFQFSFVSQSAEALLGHPCSRWVSEVSFWADQVVHPADRDEAIAYCALATGKGRDHAFEYRATAADGRTLTLIDYVQVVRGPRGIATRLRGIMIDVSGTEPGTSSSARWQSPSLGTLQAGT
jgi:PAS domain-containing protein